jgi:3-keto-disaccharide hydrolase
MFVSRLLICGCAVLALGLTAPAIGQEKLNVPPPGFTALFNGKDLTNWKGMPLKANPNEKAKSSRPHVPMSMPERRKATPEELATAQKLGDEQAREHWKVEDGILVYDGAGRISLCTAKDYGDFEFYCDWKIKERGDSGIYLRGTPQVQIWDPFNMPVTKNGEEKGSGSLWNNKKGERFPDVLADNPIGQWNTFYIKMVGEKVTIDLNGKRVVNDVTLENYWEPDQPVYSTGPIELQDHGNTLYFRNIFVKELLR